MRKTTIAAALLAATMLMTGCGGNESSITSSSSGSTAAESKTAAELTAELMAAVELPEMAEVTEENMKIFYKIDSADLVDYSAYIAGAGVYPDEFGVFLAKDKDTAAAIKVKLEQRIAKQRETYESYSPDEMYKFDDCFVTVNGETVFFSVCGDNATAKSIFG